MVKDFIAIHYLINMHSIHNSYRVNRRISKCRGCEIICCMIPQAPTRNLNIAGPYPVRL